MVAYYSDYCHKKSAVYRLFDADSNLLYVGMALHPENRIVRHRRKPWGKKITHFTVEWHEGRHVALAAENHAIATENPAHNIYRPKTESA